MNAALWSRLLTSSPQRNYNLIRSAHACLAGKQACAGAAEPRAHGISRPTRGACCHKGVVRHASGVSGRCTMQGPGLLAPSADAAARMSAGAAASDGQLEEGRHAQEARPGVVAIVCAGQDFRDRQVFCLHKAGRRCSGLDCGGHWPAFDEGHRIDSLYTAAGTGYPKKKAIGRATSSRLLRL